MNPRTTRHNARAPLAQPDAQPCYETPQTPRTGRPACRARRAVSPEIPETSAERIQPAMPHSRQTHSTAQPPNRRSRRTAASSSGPSTKSTADAPNTAGRGTPGLEDRGAQEDAVALLERVRQRLGITEPLSYHRMRVPLDRLVVHDVTPAMRRDAHLLAANLKLVGLVNPPSVLPLPAGAAADDAERDGDDGMRYEVFLGRRRVLSAQELSRTHHLPGWDELSCHVYDVPDDPTLARRMRALLTLSENGCRSPAWVEELLRLVEFLDHPVPLTDKELWTALGIRPADAKARLKLARLPRPLLEQVFDGSITSQALLHRVARLTREQQDALAERAAAGDLIAPALVDRALRGQIDAGLAVPVLQASLGQSWEFEPQQPRAWAAPPARTPSPDGAEPPNVPPALPASPMATAATSEARTASATREQPQRGSLDAGAFLDALKLLHGLLPLLASEPRLTRARLLAEALLHELEPEAQRYATHRHEPTHDAA
jgi:ParB-like chromosome segregation protein Spo0J